MGALRRRDLLPGEHRIRAKRRMPQTGLVPVRASFSKYNRLYETVVQCLEQLKYMDQEFLPYSESGFSCQFSVFSIPYQLS